MTRIIPRNQIIEEARKVFNVKEYGAVGDGVANDTSYLQNVAGLAAGGTIYIPKGVYKTNGTITIPTGTTVMFEGRGSVIRYTGAGDAFYVANSKGVYFKGGGTVDLSTAGVNSIGMHFAGLWFSTIDSFKFVQGPLNSIGVLIETSQNGGDHFGSYDIDIVNCDFTEGRGHAAIKTKQTTGEGAGVWRNTHIRIVNGWSKDKDYGVYFDQASTSFIHSFAVDNGIDGYYIKDSDALTIHAAELGPVSGWGINFGAGVDSTYLVTPSYTGLSGTLGYMNTANYTPTEFSRGTVTLKGSNQVANDYYSRMESFYSYAKSFSWKVRGGGGESELLKWGDSLGLHINGGGGGTWIDQDLSVYKNGSSAALKVKSPDGTKEVSVTHSGSNASIQSAENISLISGSSLVVDNNNNATSESIVINGKQQSGNTIAIAHDKPAASDASVAALGINLRGAGTAAQGIYVDSSGAGGTTGNLLELRNSGNGALNKLFSVQANGQVSVNSGSSAAAASAQLQVDSTTRGFLPPRMTTAQKNAILTPQQGLVVYDTAANKLSYYDGAAWVNI